MAVTRVVGTSDECDLRIEDAEYMSNRHFALTQADDGSVTVEDLGSMNGTEVYIPSVGWARAWAPVPIGPGSKIYAGRVLFKIGADGRAVSVVKDVSVFDRDKR